MNSVQTPSYQAGMDARFAIAARHSRMVRVLRVAVPAAVMLAMATIIVVSVFNPFRMLMPKLPLDMGNLVVSGTKITMESPHMAGYTPDQRPYEVWAKTATQDVTDPDHLDLKTLRAKVLTEDQSTVTLIARTGLMDTKKQLLDLHKDIFLQTSTGYEARLSQAFVDMAKGIVTSDEHVDVKLTNGTHHLRQAQDHRKRRSDQVRRQCRDASGPFRYHGVHRPSRAPAAAAPERRGPSSQDAVFFQQVRQLEMIFMMMFSSRSLRIARIAHGAWTAIFAFVLVACGEAAAQSAVQGVPNAMQGFSQNRDQPIQIEAATLEMRDKKKEATFSGNVKVVQGDTTMTSKVLVVFYEFGDSAGSGSGGQCQGGGESSAGADPGRDPGPRRQFAIKRLEAKGNVVVTQKDQVVTGESAVFDTKTNLVTMVGGVVLTQGKNVLRGDRLLVDMTTGVSRVESDSGKVQGLFHIVRPERPDTAGFGIRLRPRPVRVSQINRNNINRLLRWPGSSEVEARRTSLYLPARPGGAIRASNRGVSLGKGHPLLHVA